MAEYFGYNVDPIEDHSTPGDAGEPSVVVHLLIPYGDVVLTQAQHDNIVSMASSPESYVAAVLAQRDLNKTTWEAAAAEQAENLEAGTPTTDHSSEPQA